MVVVERHASFTGLDTGAVDLTAPIPNTSKIGVWRIEPSGHYALMGLMDDPHGDGGGRAGEEQLSLAHLQTGRIAFQVCSATGARRERSATDSAIA